MLGQNLFSPLTNEPPIQTTVVGQPEANPPYSG
jgi:hypothetical protein